MDIIFGNVIDYQAAAQYVWSKPNRVENSSPEWLPLVLISALGAGD